MMEAGVAYYQTTGKDKLLHVVERLADHIISMFGEDKEPGIPGHQEVEIGLMKLYRATGKEKYKDMARYFLEERGKIQITFTRKRKKRLAALGAVQLRAVRSEIYADTCHDL